MLFVILACVASAFLDSPSRRKRKSARDPGDGGFFVAGVGSSSVVSSDGGSFGGGDSGCGGGCGGD